MTLEILTEDPVFVQICRDYWEMDENGEFSITLKSISEKYQKKNTEINKIINDNCYFIYDGLCCKECEEEYFFENRTDYKKNRNMEAWTCGDCQDKLRSALVESKYNILRQAAEKSLNDPCNPYLLNLRQLVSISALVRFAGNESLSHIQAYSLIKSDRFSPKSEYGISIITELYASGVIVVSPNSDLSRISLNEEGGFEFYIDKVEFLIRHSDPVEFINIVEEIISSKNFALENKKEIEVFSQEIALQECLEYLDAVLTDHRLSYKPGEKTIIIIKKLLENYSVSQIYNFIWRAGKDAAAFYLRNRVSKDHAAKTVVGNIERQMDRALANNWEVKPYNRNYDYPQSAISRVLYNTILKTDDGGFNISNNDLFLNVI